jgi:hypothetical protein
LCHFMAFLWYFGHFCGIFGIFCGFFVAFIHVENFVCGILCSHTPNAYIRNFESTNS